MHGCVPLSILAVYVCSEFLHQQLDQKRVLFDASKVQGSLLFFVLSWPINIYAPILEDYPGGIILIVLGCCVESGVACVWVCVIDVCNVLSLA